MPEEEENENTNVDLDELLTANLENEYEQEEDDLQDDSEEVQEDNQEDEGEERFEEQSQQNDTEEETTSVDSSQTNSEAAEIIRKAAATFENAVNRFENTPSEQNKKAAEKAQSKLDVLLEMEDIDIQADGSAKAIRTIAEEVRTQSQSISDIADVLRSQREITTEQSALISDANRRAEFDSNHESLHGKYDDIVARTRQSLIDDPPPGTGSLPEEAWDFFVNERFNAILQGELDSAQGETKGGKADIDNSGVRKPKRTSSIQSRSRSKSSSGNKISEEEAMNSLIFNDDD